MLPRLHLAPLLSILAASGVSAQEALRAGEEQLVNYAFATQLGSGIYDLAGRTLQIYRMPFSYSFSQPAADRPGVRLTLPVTVGLVDFEPEDVLETGLPESLDTLSFVPGIELDWVLSPHWHFLPFVEAGRALELGDDADAGVYSFGAHATGLWNDDAVDLRLDLGVTYTAVEPDAPLHKDDLFLLEAGIEGRHSLGLSVAGHPLDWGVYVLGQAFLNRADEPLDRADANASPYQFEAGLTFGTRSRVTVWQIPVPRVGLGYRFGDDIEAWRLVLGVPF
jgi:predicted nucleotidyltransferase